MKVSNLFITHAVAAIALVSAATMARAESYAWVDWVKSPNANTVNGTLTLASGTVKVKLTAPVISWAQLGNSGEGDYWSSGNPDAYAVTGAPVGTDLIAFVGGTEDQVYKVQFSKPVKDPVFAIMSLGRSSAPARYVFVQKPTLVSSGVGYYGGCATCLWVKAKTVTGTEGHGVVKFIGTYSTISWRQPDYEYWHGVTLGAPM